VTFDRTNARTEQHACADAERHPASLAASTAMRDGRAVVEVAWDDDAQDRWILWWYRYDESRHERRNTVVAAFTKRAEFDGRLAEASKELERLKAEGKAEPVERLSGVFHPTGYRAEVRERRTYRRPDRYRIVARRSDDQNT